MRNEGESCTGVQPAAQRALAVGRRSFFTTDGARQDRRLDRSNINVSAEPQLPAREQPRDAGHQGGRHAGSAGPLCLASRCCARKRIPRRQHTVPTVQFRPIAKPQGVAGPVRRTDGQHRRRGGRDVRARTAFVSGGGNDQDALVFAQPDRSRQRRLGFTRLVIHARADIDHVGADCDGQRDRASQVHLRAGDERAVVLFPVNRYHHASALRRNSPHGAIMLAENQTRHMGPVP